MIRAARGLRFLALDELHTYRGRQGADVAMLVRRLRDACQSPNLQCVGASATMSSEGSRVDQRATVARVASRLFGAEVTPEAVIGETLVRATGAATFDVAALVAAVRRAGHDGAAPDPAGSDTEPQLTGGDGALGEGVAGDDYAALAADPLDRWIETEFGLDTDPETGDLIRSRPITVGQAAKKLAGQGLRPPT